MLKSLFIRNFVLIDSLDIKFDKGFSVITGYLPTKDSGAANGYRSAGFPIPSLQKAGQANRLRKHGIYLMQTIPGEECKSPHHTPSHS